MNNGEGLLVVISGPSGAGKDTVIGELLEKVPELKLSVSATTRPPREGEADGMDYYFMSKEQFGEMKRRGDMLESAEYCDNFYGTPRAPIDVWRGQGCDVLLEIEVQGGSQIKKACQDCVRIFILPPSVRELERRLRCRGTESEEDILLRLEAARAEMEQVENYDYLVINDSVEQAVSEIRCIIIAEKHKVSKNSKTIEGVLAI